MGRFSDFLAAIGVSSPATQYRTLFEKSAAGVCIVSADGHIVECNPAFAALLDASSPVELRGLLIQDQFEQPVEWPEMLDLLAKKPALAVIEVEMKRRRGGTVWVILSVTLLTDGAMHITATDISDRKRAEEQIEFHAYHDVLTHLPNRKLFADRLLQNVTHARRTGRAVGVIFIDLDEFKAINDTLGHTGGDELLLEMARRLRRSVREEDTVARLGGDEFAIALSELRHAEDAIVVAQKVLKAIQVPVTIGRATLDVTASLGIALYPVDGHDPETLLRNADSAMYKAKEAGRNTYQLYTDDMKIRAMQKQSLESRLRRAIDRGELTLNYQPQVNLVSGRMTGLEALVRWHDHEDGTIEPGRFLPVAEESRLIVPLGKWVLEQACRQMAAWHAQGFGQLRVSVNLSVREFQQQDLVRTVEEALVTTGLAPSSLEIEVTEATLMYNAEAAVDALRDLGAMGVGVAIDHYGTGWSSLNYLKRFHLTALKIDRAFVSDITTHDSSAAIVSAVLGIGRSLKLRVIADGVETSQEFAFLRRAGCDEGQGYHFSHPVPAEELPHLIAGPLLTTKAPRLSV
jgi:diguanylate cyclase (GGDEF)-like protein/PAS domain S-box-containing protein